MYFVDVKLAGAGASWRIKLPYGRFPVPPDEPSVQEPVFPYGGYMKLRINEDPEMYGRFPAATFCHFRKMHMNTAVLGRPLKYRLDLAQKYRIKAIIRLGGVGGHEHYVPRDLVYHPAVLTYMIGDEPKIGPKLDAHKQLFETLTKKYPEYKPITCTVYDSYAQGGVTDPCRIYNEHVAECSRRFGYLRLKLKELGPGEAALLVTQMKE